LDEALNPLLIQSAPSLRQVLSFAIPVMLSQAAETVMTFTDRLFLAQLDKFNLAAALSGGLSSIVFSSFFVGLISYVNVLSAHSHGAGKSRGAVRVCLQGLLFSLIAYPISLGLIPLIQQGFTWIGHNPEQIKLESAYFSLLMFGSIFSFLRAALSGYFLGLGKTRSVMVANILGMLLNVPLNLWLIFGSNGIKEFFQTGNFIKPGHLSELNSFQTGWGIKGAAWGTLIASFVIFLILAFQFLLNQEWKLYYKAIVAKTEKFFDAQTAKQLLHLGSPAGMEQFLNIFAFNIFIQFMHSYGANTAASITIALNYDLISFIPLSGIGIAVSAMVGQRLGAKQMKAAEETVFLALRLSLSYALLMAALFLFGAPHLARLFAKGLDADSLEIVDTASTMLRLASLYLLGDACQVVFMGALRGAGDTRFIMLVSGGLYYLMAGGSIFFVKVLHLNPLLVWIWFIAFLLTLALCGILRYKRGNWRQNLLIKFH